MRQLEQTNKDLLAMTRARAIMTSVVLIMSLLVTYNVWRGARQSAIDNLQSNFEFRTSELNDRIRQRLTVYEQVLSSGVGLFHASEEVSRDEFRRFFEALRLGERFPGIHGVGYATIVAPDALDRHVRAVRAEGFPDYTVFPPGPRPVYTSVVYLEPFTGSNLRAFGFDMYSEPIRRAAMDQARDSARAAISGKVTLVQESGNDVQPGFLMYEPVYRDGGASQTIADRRRSIVGWVYAPFRMVDFMDGLEGPHPPALDIEIFDGETIERSALLFDAEKSGVAIEAPTPLKRISRVEAANRIWTVVATARPEFEAGSLTDRPQLLLQSGIAISLLLTLLIWLFLDDRARALHAARQAMQLALYDPLTGLPNRKLLDERLTQALVKQKRSSGHLALLFIDLDKFKPVNDNFGHAYGDLLLKEVAHRLLACVRESDTASRLGGDEFVALLADVEGPHGVAVVADKVLRQLNAPYEISGQVFEISASIGAALYPEHGTDAKSLVRSADLAMYAAKDAGRANVQFAPLPSRRAAPDLKSS
ncbi:diguanylate cyclase [Oxalobacteraceae bacterium OM1]|nr:diguanylate cyclase [Oxalobacteraceae bacterium OM1]